MSKHGENPFKGLYPYEEEDSAVFFGRDREAEALFSLVRFNFLTLVFGKSGIGKTSLLNAGLSPRLRREGFFPIRIRPDYSRGSLPLKVQVVREMNRQSAAGRVRVIEKGGKDRPPAFREEETLWEYQHRTEYMDADGNPVTPVLLLDQFEEIFTIGRFHPDRELFLEELYYLVDDQVPPRVRERILKEGKMLHHMEERLKERIVIALREDYLPHVNTLRVRIPSIDRVSFRVSHLTGGQAREVMGMPGGFRDQDIIGDILKQFHPEEMEPGKEVSDGQMEVEPSLLSLLCFQVFEEGVSSLSEHQKDKILTDFYDGQLDRLTQGTETAEFIETRLLTEGGFRTPFYMDRAFKLRGAVDEAVNRKILRKVFYGNKEHVEIIHDVLAPVIKAKKNLREEEKQRRKLLEELRRKRVIIRIILAAGIVSMLLTVFSFVQKHRADEQFRGAVLNRLALESILILPTDNVKAIRIAEAAYKISKSSPPPAAVVQAFSWAAYSNRNRLFYNVVLNHDESIRSAVFSPDGGKILTASDDNTAKLWDLQGNLLADMKGHTDSVWSAVFSPDGGKILTASSDNTAKLWDLQGNLLADMKEHTNYVRSAIFSSDGGKILTASGDNTAKLWDLQGNLMADMKGHTDSVSRAVFSPDGGKILTASRDNTAKLWDLQGNLLADMKGHTSGVITAVFSPDGGKILTASADITAKLWDLQGNLLADMKGHTDAVINAVFSPGGGKILTASDDNTVKLWDLQGNLLADVKGHTSLVRSAVFSPDGGKILTASNDNTAKLWDLQGNLMADMKGHTSGVITAVFSPDGGKILTASADKTAKLWDLQGNLLADVKGHTSVVAGAFFSPDGKRIVTASFDHTAVIRPTPESIMEWLKTAPIPKLSQKEKERLGISNFDLDE